MNVELRRNLAFIISIPVLIFFAPLLVSSANSQANTAGGLLDPRAQAVDKVVLHDTIATVDNSLPVSHGQETKTGVVTAYSCDGLTTPEEILMNCPSLFSGEPKTADGTAPEPYKTIACDPANMGRTFDLEGVGQVRCTDTGGAIKGAGRFDLYVADVQEARDWGVKRINYQWIGGK